MEKVQWNSIDKKQNGLKYSKNDKSSTLPGSFDIILHLYSRQTAYPLCTVYSMLSAEKYQNQCMKVFLSLAKGAGEVPTI